MSSRSDRGSESSKENLADLLPATDLPKAFPLPTLDEALDLAKIVDTEPLHAAIVFEREQRARSFVGGELTCQATERTEVDRRDPGKEALANRLNERSSVTE